MSNYGFIWFECGNECGFKQNVSDMNLWTVESKKRRIIFHGALILMLMIDEEDDLTSIVIYSRIKKSVAL